MDREKELYDAARQWVMDNCSHDDTLAENAFLAGAEYEYMRNDYRWMDVEEDLPYNHEELIQSTDSRFTKVVLVLTSSGDIKPSYMRKAYMLGEDAPKWVWQIFDSKVVQWMRLPEFKLLIS